MLPRSTRPGRRADRRGGRPLDRTHRPGRAVLVTEPLEDRAQASAAAPALPTASPDLAAALVAPPDGSPLPTGPVYSPTADGPDLAHRLTSLDRTPADADLIAGATPPPAAFAAAGPAPAGTSGPARDALVS